MIDLSTQTITAPPYADFVLPHWRDARQRGLRCAILTIVGATGPSPRPVGSQLAVSEDGRALGLLSGGCIETALVRDALEAIRQGRNHVERYGEGSRFIDLRLPCGSGLDIYFDVTMPDAIGNGIIEAREGRRPVTLLLDTRAHGHELMPGANAISSGPAMSRFARHYLPACRMVMAGSGATLLSLAHLCHASEIEVEAVTTDRETADSLHASGLAVRHVPRWAGFDWSKLDAWTGLVTLSHEHEDETDILAPALASDAFYVGALGSRRTHDARCRLLREAGAGEDAIARVRGPVGLPIGAASPPEIAIAILAELVAHWRRGPANIGR